jgi:hypothetical protein
MFLFFGRGKEAEGRRKDLTEGIQILKSSQGNRSRAQ